MSPDLGNLSGVQQRPPGSVEFIKIILFWLLLRQVHNLGFELEILHVQHYFYLTLNEQTRIAPPSAPVCPDMSIRPRPGYLTCWPLSNSPFKSDLCLFSPIVGFSVSPSNKWISHQSWVIFFISESDDFLAEREKEKLVSLLANEKSGDLLLKKRK